MTAQVAPHGTSLNASKGTTATSNNTPNSSSGNVTASVKPQSTSLQQSTNQTSATGAGQILLAIGSIFNGYGSKGKSVK